MKCITRYKENKWKNRNNNSNLLSIFFIIYSNSYHDGKRFVLSHLPPQCYLAQLLCPPCPALMPLLPPLLLELSTMTHTPYLLFFLHSNYKISVNLLMTWPSSRSWPPPIPNYMVNRPLSSFRLNHLTPGASCTKRTGRVRWSFLSLGSQGDYWSIGPPHCSQEDQMI